jgi:hypothetical protein
MCFKSILIILLISIVSVKNNKLESKTLPDRKEVLKTLIANISAIEVALENALKNISGADLINEVEKLLLSLLTSMHKSIGHQHLLRDPLEKFIKQINHALAKLQDLPDDGGNVTDFGENYIQPIIPSLKNLTSVLNELADSGSGSEVGGHQGGHHGGQHGVHHGALHGGQFS